ncbi:MAG: TatD family hydrolase [Candidatus Freyarchaeota archaeon]|nr:TatD family hydrolase [Candidatus Jordarchaeia archaeon]
MMLMIDSHVHSVFRSFEDFEALGIAGVTDVVSVAFYPVAPSSPTTLIDHFRHIVEAEPARFNGALVKFHPSIGVHPRCIPPKAKSVLDYMREIVDCCVAIGEVGLEAATDVEMDILREQLNLSKEEDLPVIVHTPKKEKRAVTTKILSVLKETGYYRVVIDHVNLENIDLVAGFDVYVGLTVQHGKLNPEILLKIVEKYVVSDPEKFLLNTDLGREPADLFSLPKAVQFLRVKGIDRDIIELISGKNASSLFRI